MIHCTSGWRMIAGIYLVIGAMSSANAHQIPDVTSSLRSGTTSSSSTKVSAVIEERVGHDGSLDCQQPLDCGSDELDLEKRSNIDQQISLVDFPTRHRQRISDTWRNEVPSTPHQEKVESTQPLMSTGYRRPPAVAIAVPPSPPLADELRGTSSALEWLRQRWRCPYDDVIESIDSQPNNEYVLLKETGQLIKRSSLPTSDACKCLHRSSSDKSTTTTWSKRPRLRYYRDDEGPKRNWRTNMMRVWGKRSFDVINDRYSNAEQSSDQSLSQR